MIRYLCLGEILKLHGRVIAQSGGSHGLRDRGSLESSLAQPRMQFGGRDLYASLTEKAATLGFLLVRNHPFVDGNKRIGHLAMETFLVLNGQEIVAPVDEQEAVILAVAAGQVEREAFTKWLAGCVRKAGPDASTT